MDCNKLVWDLNRNRKSTLNVWNQVCQSTFTEKVFCRILLDVFFFIIIIIFTLKHISSVNLFFFFAVKIIEPYKNARHSLVNSPKGIVILYKTVIDFCAV